MSKKNKSPTLEASLQEISQVIEKMEHGELTLEQSLTEFERGIGLIKHCQKVLSEAEQKVQILMQKNNQESLSAYGEDNNENEGEPDSDEQDT